MKNLVKIIKITYLTFFGIFNNDIDKLIFLKGDFYV